MKQLIIIVLTILPLISFGQEYIGFSPEMFLTRQPSARAEAMGQAYSSVDGDLATVFFNPAGIAGIKGLEVNASYVSHAHFFSPKSHYDFFSAGYKISKQLTLALSRNHYSSGRGDIGDFDGNIIGEAEYKTSIYSLSLATQPNENLSIGFNVNYFDWAMNQWERNQSGLSPIEWSTSTLYFDFGLIKKIPLKQSDKKEQSVNIGVSITNLNFAKPLFEFANNNVREILPVISRLGANYQLASQKPSFIDDKLNAFRFLILAEYLLFLNSNYYSGLHTGAEFTLAELLSFRAGYYRVKLDDFGFPDNKSHDNNLTYGLGFQLPLYKLGKTPLNINLDYANLPPTNYSNSFSNLPHFSTYTLRLSWILEK